MLDATRRRAYFARDMRCDAWIGPSMIIPEIGGPTTLSRLPARTYGAPMGASNLGGGASFTNGHVASISNRCHSLSPAFGGILPLNL